MMTTQFRTSTTTPRLSSSKKAKEVKALEEKAVKFDYDCQKKCVEDRDYEKLEMYVMELLIGIN